MRRSTKILLGTLGTAVLAVGVFVFVNRRSLTRQWHCYRVASAESAAAAREEMAWFIEGPDARGRLGELVAKWGTGNLTFDLYLAEQVADPGSHELLREVFFRELQSRPHLAKRWAHYWAFQAPAEPGEELRSMVAYFDAAADAASAITWRETLELLVVFQWTDRADLIAGLTPDRWTERYGDWQTKRPEPLPRIERPADAFPVGRSN